MSLQLNNQNNEGSAVRLRAGHFAFAVKRMIAPLLAQITDDRQDRKVADARRRAALEIAALPAELQQDVAFSQELKHNDI